ncbi:hypothetical protein [Planktothricoides sp. SR001]
MGLIAAIVAGLLLSKRRK